MIAGVAKGVGSFLAGIGSPVVGMASHVGGLATLLARTVRALFPPRFDLPELWRNLYKMGNQSVPIVLLTAFFVGGIMIVQAAVFVQRFGATSMVGWGAGYSVLREIGPILIALMFSGRVGSNNTAELGTMVVTEQIDGLRALSIDPIRYLIVPRILSMMIMLFLLTVLGDLVALTGAGIFGRIMIGIDLAIYYNGIVNDIGLGDLFHGLIKSVFFGGIIALNSCHFGLSVKGGAVGVGRAVNASVVGSAVGIVLGDYFLTYLLT
ncbi:MAG: ABC transporter permease [Polyangia bacterium]|jgi:phospholipid/cholesterol/gamma-HCH transport system permease protein|nr:ABC transporter permease [Polyangia bacterium]